MTRLVLCALLFAPGCTLSYTIHPPKSSALRYEAPAALAAPQLADARSVPKTFSEGRIRIRLEFEEGGDELAYLQKHVALALSARGVALGGAGAGDALIVKVREFGVRNHRVSGFSPMVTFTRFSADVQHGAQIVRIAAYSKQNKVPVWSMNELSEPCFNRPLQLVVGELAAKLNRSFVGARISDAQLQSLIAQSGSARGAELLQTINELGWSNHPGALAALSKLASAEGEDVRGAALGAIGTLGSPESLSMLRDFVGAGSSHTDRYMAIKAVGDLGTPEALTFLSELDRAESDSAVHEIVRLYLEARPAAPAPVPPPATADVAVPTS